jgi:zinc-ribbon domain
VRCPRCGNENPEENRFCGMCGTTLLAPAPSTNKPQAVGVGSTSSTRSEAVPSRAPAETVRKAPVPPPDDTPSISGPSFLGLNNPPPSRETAAKRASISIDPNSAPPASNLHYLLEDEEEHKGSGLWKFILILVALGLAVGFGYLRWKNQGFAWLNPPAKKPAITEEQPGAGDIPASSPGSTAVPTSATPSSTTPSNSPAVQPAAQPPAGAAPATANSATPSNPGPVAGAPSANPPASTDGSKPADGTNSEATPDKVSSAAGASPPLDKSGPDSPKADTVPDTTDDAPAPAKPKAEPAPKPRPTVQTDPISEARKYLYGKGAPQDCERGLRLLKPAANAGNPKAMVEMGALYSAGLCAPHDLPTAYRWFALALRKEPDNDSVQADLQKLWGEMTQPERQLAIKLSQ